MILSDRLRTNGIRLARVVVVVSLVASLTLKMWTGKPRGVTLPDFVHESVFVYELVAVVALLTGLYMAGSLMAILLFAGGIVYSVVWSGNCGCAGRVMMDKGHHLLMNGCLGCAAVWIWMHSLRVHVNDSSCPEGRPSQFEGESDTSSPSATEEGARLRAEQADR